MSALWMVLRIYSVHCLDTPLSKARAGGFDSHADLTVDMHVLHLQRSDLVRDRS